MQLQGHWVQLQGLHMQHLCSRLLASLPTYHVCCSSSETCGHKRLLCMFSKALCWSTSSSTSTISIRHKYDRLCTQIDWWIDLGKIRLPIDGWHIGRSLMNCLNFDPCMAGITLKIVTLNRNVCINSQLTCCYLSYNRKIQVNCFTLEIWHCILYVLSSKSTQRGLYCT